MAIGLTLLLAAVASCREDNPTRPTPTPDPSSVAARVEGQLPGLAARLPEFQRRLEAALQAKGGDYQPRTHHKSTDGSPTFINRLIFETSPYLLQHAHNPVNWYAWGDEAFERARREDKPVLLSIGYSTCHWCHVMERESFEDLEIAGYINEHYIAIKVDREERPDVDEVYMTAVHLLAGRGGWPMTTVLTPDREPFFGGTYFPARDGDRGRSRGFLSILRELAEKYAESPSELVEQARDLSRKMAARSRPRPPRGLPGAESIAEAARELAGNFDNRYGGFGKAPKFPRPATFELLLRYARRSSTPENTQMVAFTLDKMIEGGIHDHIGGGFHRYSVDNRWLVPHFEKMLYDNGQLVVTLLETYQATGRTSFAAAAAETLDYLAREMTDPAGAFYSATDADSPNPETGHDDEGWFFTWTQSEISQVVGPKRAKLITAYYATSRRGNFEKRNILHTPKSLPKVADELGLAPQDLASELAQSREAMYEFRLGRPPPLRDNKIITSWNGLAISAFAFGGLVLDNPEYVERAAKAAGFILDNMRDATGRLYRTFNAGRPRHKAYLDDYAFLIRALLDLHEATSELGWLREALALQEQLDLYYHDDNLGGYFLTAHDAEKLLTREKPDYDGSEPSGNSVAALNLLRLSELTGNQTHRERASKLLLSQGRRIKRSGLSVPLLLSALDFFIDRPLQIFVVYPDGGDPKPLVDVIRTAFVPNRILAVVSERSVSDHIDLVPGLADKRALKGQPTAYVCEQNICQLPTPKPDVLKKQLERVTPYPGADSRK